MDDRENMRALFEQYAPELDTSDPKVARRQRILAAATELFVEQGYRKTSIDEVAQRAHVAKGTVYANFENKTSLLFSVVAYEKRRFMGQTLEMMSPDVPGPERLRRYLKLAIAMPNESPLLAQLLHGDEEISAMLSELSPDLVEKLQAVQMQFLGGLLRDGLGRELSPEEITEKANILYSLVVKVAQAAKDPFGLGFTGARYGELVLDLLYEGMTRAWGAAGAAHAAVKGPREDPASREEKKGKKS